MPQLAAQRRVHQAFRWLHLHDGLLMDWQRTLVGIPAPPFGEAPRAAWLLEQFASLGLTGTGSTRKAMSWDCFRFQRSHDGVTKPVDGQRAVVLSAHIDTVFPAGTEVAPRSAERD